MTYQIATYQITDERAIVYERPAGVRIRHMILDELFSGRPAPGRPDWIMRTDDDGITPRGYIKSALCTPIDLPAAISTIQDLPPPSALGGMVDRLAGLLALGRSRERAAQVRKALGDVAAAIVDNAASQAADVTTRLLERQAADRLVVGGLRQRIERLEGARERVVGGLPNNAQERD